MHPVLLDLGPLALPAYGAAVVMASLVAFIHLRWRARSLAVPGIVAAELALTGLLAGSLGAKLALVLVHPDWFASRAGLGRVLGSAGLVAAGVGAAALAVAMVARRRGLAPLAAADLLAPSAALGQGLGRLGCLAAGCCYGRPTTLPWSIIYTDPLAQRLAGTPLGIALHPTPVYLGLMSLALAGFLTMLATRSVGRGGIFGAYLLIDGVGRLAIDRTRWPVPGAGLSLGLCAAAAATGLILVARARSLSP